MALINCPDCGTEVSYTANRCPKCAANIAGYVANIEERKAKSTKNKLFLWLIALIIIGTYFLSQCERQRNSYEHSSTTDTNGSGIDFTNQDDENNNQDNVDITNEDKSEIISNSDYKFDGDYRAINESLSKLSDNFEKLFTLKGYFNFLDRFWYSRIKAAFNHSYDCANEYPPFCNLRDIIITDISAENITLEITEVCYPTVASACEPYLKLNLSYTQLEAFLNENGKSLFKLLKDYSLNESLQRISKIDKESKMFVWGKIDNKYAFSLGIQMSYTNSFDGFYFYNNKKIWIELQGELLDDRLILKEYYKDQQTGSFDISIPGLSNIEVNDYSSFTRIKNKIDAKWFDSDNQNEYKIDITDMIISN